MSVSDSLVKKRNPLIVGDIHGCFFEFLELLKKVDYNPKKHHLILLGDLINRGPYSFKVLQWVRERDIEVITGNHERGFLKALERGLPLNPIFRELADRIAEDLKDWTDWISRWPYFIEEKDFILVHGGLVPGEHPSSSDPRRLAYIRTWDGKDLGGEEDTPWYEFYKGEKLVVYGHWAKQGLKIRHNTIGLDSGCVYGRQLSALLLPERKIFQVDAKKNYCVL